MGRLVLDRDDLSLAQSCFACAYFSCWAGYGIVLVLGSLVSFTSSRSKWGKNGELLTKFLHEISEKDGRDRELRLIKVGTWLPCILGPVLYSCKKL